MERFRPDEKRNDTTPHSRMTSVIYHINPPSVN